MCSAGAGEVLGACIKIACRFQDGCQESHRAALGNLKARLCMQELKALREAGVRTFAEAEAREAEARHLEADAAAAPQPPAPSQDVPFTTPLPLRRPEVSCECNSRK